MRAPRIVFYAVNGLGLGHVTRLLAIARAVRTQSPEAEILFLTTSEASHLVYREGFAAVKFPSRAAAQSGNLRAASWQRLMHTGVLSALTAFDPHILVVDTFPAGTASELLPALRWIPRRVFVFRAQRLERAREEFFQNTLRGYNLILIPHHEGEEEIPFPDTARGVWTGPITIREPHELLSREAARAALGFAPDEILALVTLGGGGDCDLQQTRATFARAAPGINARWIATRGPLESAVEIDRTSDILEIWPLMPYLRAFDWALSATGYNTVAELQAAGVPSILWPFARDVDDQNARAQTLAAQGRALALSESNAEKELPDALQRIARPETRRALQHAMEQRAAQHSASESGAQCAARAVLELL
ncbi:MAG TPA: glycosyltransferase [Abditibacteriaceae bacterium]|jgi:predicted glycosyltransferase